MAKNYAPEILWRKRQLYRRKGFLNEEGWTSCYYLLSCLYAFAILHILTKQFDTSRKYLRKHIMSNNFVLLLEHYTSEHYIYKRAPKQCIGIFSVNTHKNIVKDAFSNSKRYRIGPGRWLTRQAILFFLSLELGVAWLLYLVGLALSQSDLGWANERRIDQELLFLYRCRWISLYASGVVKLLEAYNAFEETKRYCEAQEELHVRAFTTKASAMGKIAYLQQD